MNTYRILEQGEAILDGDEYLDETDNIWRIRQHLNPDEVLKLAAEGGYHAPHRRKVEHTRCRATIPESTEPPFTEEELNREPSLGDLLSACNTWKGNPKDAVWKPGENDLTKLAEGYPNNDPKGAAGALKPQLQLIPTVAMREEAKALDDGRNKYGQDNWRTNKVCASTYIGAILRHTLAYRDGEDVDPESKSGVNHLGSVRACCAILLDAAANGTLVDDRPTNHDTTI